MNRIKSGLLGFAAGLLNGLFGAGGGMAAVPMLSAMGVETRKSHATSIAIILPLSAVSAYLYLRGGHLAWREAFPYLPGGIAGCLAGSYLLPRMSTLWLRRIFGALVLFSALRLLLR